MRVLQHCIYFPPEVGGLESHVYWLLRGMVDRGHEVDIVTSRSQPDLPPFEVMDGIRVHRTWFPGRNTLGWAAHAALSTPKTGELALRADIIHAQAFASVLPAQVARRVPKIPMVSTYHTSHFLKLAERPFWRPILARFVRWADHNLAASEEIARVAEKLAPGVRVEALTNGVETSLFRPTEPTLAPSEHTHRILVPRRLFEKNGVEFFVRAMPAIVEAVDAEAVLIGDGPEREKLERIAGELGVSDRITFLGRQPNQEMPGLLNSGDLAVFPSLMEATSVAALECMACELPVAASRVGGLPEIVDDSVGGLFAPADPESLANTVVRLLRGSDLPERGRAARKRVVDRWSNARLVGRHLEIYEELVARRRAGEPA